MNGRFTVRSRTSEPSPPCGIAWVPEVQPRIRRAAAAPSQVARRRPEIRAIEGALRTAKDLTCPMSTSLRSGPGVVGEPYAIEIEANHRLRTAGQRSIRQASDDDPVAARPKVVHAHRRRGQSQIVGISHAERAEREVVESAGRIGHARSIVLRGREMRQLSVITRSVRRTVNERYPASLRTSAASSPRSRLPENRFAPAALVTRIGTG
jgi:hypothetical protein